MLHENKNKLILARDYFQPLAPKKSKRASFNSPWLKMSFLHTNNGNRQMNKTM